MNFNKIVHFLNQVNFRKLVAYDPVTLKVANLKNLESISKANSFDVVIGVKTLSLEF